MEKLRFENCEELMKEVFGNKYPPEEGKPYCHQEINGKTLPAQVGEVLGGLKSRKRKVIILWGGLEDGRKRTLEEIGKEFWITKERVRQIINDEVPEYLRHPERLLKLEPYIAKQKG